MEDEYKKWLTQLRKGYIELSVLLLIKSKGDMHGLAIINFFNSIDLQINEGTLYPLLNRMEKNDWLSSLWKIPQGKGHPRKEYKISKKGEELLPLLLKTYNEHNTSFTKLQEI